MTLLTQLYVDPLKCFEFISQKVHLCIKRIYHCISDSALDMKLKLWHQLLSYSFSFCAAVGLNLPSKTQARTMVKEIEFKLKYTSEKIDPFDVSLKKYAIDQIRELEIIFIY